MRRSNAGCRSVFLVRIGLVGCVKTKLDRRVPAKDLYTSPLFRGRRAFVEASCEQWFILSAKHGLLSPAEEVEPYDETLKAGSPQERRAWAERVLHKLDAVRPSVNGDVFEIHAGSEYRAFGLADGLRARGAAVDVPAEHLSQGAQLAFYKSGVQARPGAGRGDTAVRRKPMAKTVGAYASLADHLGSVSSDVLELSFAEIERIIGRPLPASARRHRAWWANDTTGAHSHASAWTGRGWNVGGVDLNAGTVWFRTRTR